MELSQSQVTMLASNHGVDAERVARTAAELAGAGNLSAVIKQLEEKKGAAASAEMWEKHRVLSLRVAVSKQLLERRELQKQFE